MTSTISLSELSAQIEQAKADVAFAERIAAAPALLKKLTPLYVKATEDHEKAQALAEEEAEKSRATAEKAAKDTLFAGLNDLQISEVSAPVDPSLLRSTFHISYTTWDSHSSSPKTVSADSFDSLPPNVLAWIIDRNPEKLPVSIMLLAPNAPGEAVEQYLAARRRGYLIA